MRGDVYEGFRGILEASRGLSSEVPALPLSLARAALEGSALAAPGGGLLPAGMRTLGCGLGLEVAKRATRSSGEAVAKPLPRPLPALEQVAMRECCQQGLSSAARAPESIHSPAAGPGRLLRVVALGSQTEARRAQGKGLCRQRAVKRAQSSHSAAQPHAGV